MKITHWACLVSLLCFAIGCTQAPTESGAKDDASVEAPADDSSSSPGDDAASDTDEEAEETTTPAVDDSAQVETPSTDASTPSKIELPEGALTVGSKAPALDIEHWVTDGNGAYQAVSEFEPGKVYVVEFWATWCPPCRASMPHLADIQEKYKDTVQIVSISDEDLQTVTDFLEKPLPDAVEGGPQTYAELTSKYCLTTDPDESVGGDYMRAAGQNGIPACFLVGKTGIVEWIGHPMRLDEPLEQVLNDSWDREAFAVEFQRTQAFDIYLARIMKAASEQDLDTAYDLLEKARLIADERQTMQLQQIAVQIKLAPVGQKLQSGDIEGAIADVETILGDIEEGPMKSQVQRILDSLKQQAETLAAPIEPEEPAEDEPEA